MKKVTLNDIGTAYRITVTEDDAAVDISSASDIEIVFTRPDGTEFTRTAVNVTDGTDGQLQYLSVSGDIDQIGIYDYRAKVTFAVGSIFYSITPEQFRVVE